MMLKVLGWNQMQGALIGTPAGQGMFVSPSRDHFNTDQEYVDFANNMVKCWNDQQVKNLDYNRGVLTRKDKEQLKKYFPALEARNG